MKCWRLRRAIGLAKLGCRNVEIRHVDGTLGWAEHAPYDGIAVAAGGREIPRPLLDQLGPGGRMIIPVGAEETSQVLLRVTRRGQDDFHQESLGDVRFVPLLGSSHQ